MKMTKTAEYSFNGSSITTDELADILAEARRMNAENIDIHQTSYNEPPYGMSTNTTITFNQGPTRMSGEGY